MGTMKTKLIFITVFLLPFCVRAHTFTGKVVRVIDGDTVIVADDSRKLKWKVRFAEIDAPEKAQAFGARAAEALSEKILGKAVMVEFEKTDRYGRIIGTVYLDDRNINQAMIRDGFAWWYRKYSKDNNLSKLETNARHQNRGLWTAKHPIPPWDYRKR